MEDNRPSEEPFPWEIGIFDAHCHPTDTMSSIPNIPSTMKSRILTVMATRSQDQELVAQVAEEHRVNGREAIHTSPTSNGPESVHLSGKIIPAFGWHPWFSHQLYDDSLSGEEVTYDPSSSDLDGEKLRHYNAVLSPSTQTKDGEDFITQLPTPQSLSSLLSRTRKYLEAHPHALVGEIGIDKAFRLPSHGVFQGDPEEGMTPGRRNGERLSPYRVNVDHQTRILKAQLSLAGEMGRAVSVHGVQAPGVLYDTLKSTWKGHEKRVVSSRERRRIAKGVNEDFSSSESEDDGADDAARVQKRKHKPKPYPPRICLHSFSGGIQTLKQYVDDRSCPAKVFFSFSMCVNYSTGGHERERKKHIADEVIRACPDDRLLVESDLHTAGQDMDDALEEMYRKVCEVKGWDLRGGVERIRENYEAFIFG
ncbi:Cut9-interacting protein scn1 [Cytospora mali]|uniref:Cut9-interacting protein scn1 n=1 Tax=Cytospora mali TaxID=578113 RepID=A0A194UYS0_CYTMA|nr:Cut9-interacting protein scn1 [Valsa mali var. pyri (nom. inval.)]